MAKRRKRRKAGTLKGSYKSSGAANRRRYSRVSSGSPITRVVPRGCAIVQSGAKKGKLRKGCRVSANGQARCDVLTRLPREARQRVGGKGKRYKTVGCPS